jgi:glutathione synthase/RimK-type ligase-like ATP-grasp enzyme
MIVMFVKYPDFLYHNRIARALRALGEECRLVSWRTFDFATGFEGLSPERDVLFLRTGAPRAVRIARAFERRGFHVLNDSRYNAISAEKVITNQYARANGIPVAELSVEIDKTHTEILRGYLQRYGVLVCKPVYSRNMGNFVYRIRESDAEEGLKLAQSIPGRRILVQSEITFVKLVRAIVLGRRMLVDATTYDFVHPPEWKATVCVNPNALHYREVPRKLVELAERTNIVFGGDVAYIDFFEQASGDYVLSEINHSCGLQHHERITGVPIHRHIARYVRNRARALLAQRPAQAAAA